MPKGLFGWDVLSLASTNLYLYNIVIVMLLNP